MSDRLESPDALRASSGAVGTFERYLNRETGAAQACLGTRRIGLILASASPRRRVLLQSLLPRFEVIPAEIAEIPHPAETPVSFAARVAREKAEHVAALHPQQWVLGADTVVTIDGEILGKPRDRDDAARMLRRLSGGAHRVCTAVAVACSGKPTDGCVVETEVTFRVIDVAEIHTYIAGGEPFDKAGAYGIQGSGGAFVTAVSGSYSNVIGLPLVEAAQLLARLPDAGD